MRKLLAHLGLAIPAIAGLVIGMLVATTPAQAANHPTVQSQIQHYLECLDWMLTDPAKHRQQCGPGHEFFLPYNNFAPTGITGMPDAPPPPPPPPPPSCPEHSYEHPSAYVQYADVVLVHEHHEGGDMGCKPECPVSFSSELQPPSLLHVGFYGCEHPPMGCRKPMAWTGGNASPLLLQVSENCCTYGAITDEQQGALVLLAKKGGGPGPSFNPPGPPQFHFPNTDHPYGGSVCQDAWTGVPMEAPALLV